MHALLVVFFAASVVLSAAVPTVDEELEKALAEEIKEYHFHVYFYQDNPVSNASAEALWSKINRLVDKGFFHPVPGHVFQRPIGPHSIGSYEVWCPKEHFSRTYSFMLLNRGIHQVLIHPLSNEQMKDHTNRVAFVGNEAVPLDVSVLADVLDHVPLQYPELHMGYSAPAEQRRLEKV